MRRRLNRNIEAIFSFIVLSSIFLSLPVVHGECMLPAKLRTIVPPGRRNLLATDLMFWRAVDKKPLRGEEKR
jgi:hypothetical protein